MKAGTEPDIKTFILTLTNIKNTFGVTFNNDIVFSEISLHDKTSKGKARRELLDFVKDTVIKTLVIPNTTYFDSNIEESKLEYNLT